MDSTSSCGSSRSSSIASALTDFSFEQEKVKSAFALRKERQKGQVFSVVKTGFGKLCRDPRLTAILNDCVRRCSIIAAEASLLASMHIIRLLGEGQALPVLDDTFFNQCVSCIANLGGAQSHNNPSLEHTLNHHYEPLKPEGYVNVGRIAKVMSQMLVIIAHQARQNFVVSTEATMHKRLLKWLDHKIRAHKVNGDYFTINGAYNGKSIKALMLRACLGDVECAGIMNQYKRIRELPIPVDDLEWMHDLCTEVKAALNISPDEPFDVSKRPEAYMPFLFQMLLDLGGGEEEEGDGDDVDEEGGGDKGGCGGGGGGVGVGGEDVQYYRLFSLLPQKKLKPIYITINNTILRELHLVLDDSGFDYFEGEITLFEYYFNLKKILKKNKTFECQIMTDGVGASITVSRPKPVVDEEEVGAANPTAVQRAERAAEKAAAERIANREAFLAADRVVSVDTGRNPIFQSVVYNEAAMANINEANNEHHQTVQWGRREHAHECGHNYRRRQVRIWTAKNPVVTAYNSTALTSKTSSLGRYKDHARHVLANMHSLLGFYGAQRFKRLRWKTFIKTQQAYEKIVATLKGGVENTLVIWGDAKFPCSGRGSPAVPTTTLRKKVGARVKLIEQDEFRTSKLSCCCHRDLTPFVIRGQGSYHLRVCTNDNCFRRVWDRNVSAAINIMFLFHNYNVMQQETPPAFRRAVLAPPAAAAAGGGGGAAVVAVGGDILDEDPDSDDEIDNI